MKKQLLAGIMSMVFLGTALPTTFAESISVTESSGTVAYIDKGNQGSYNPIVIPSVNQPANNPTWGNIQVNPAPQNPVPGTVTGKAQGNSGKIQRPHKQHRPPGQIKQKPVRPNKPGQIHRPANPNRPTEVYKPTTRPNKPQKPHNPNGTYKPAKPNRPTGVYRPTTPNRPTGVYKPTTPNRPTGVYKPTTPTKPSTSGRTRVHGAHWCYGACSLHDAGLHNAPRTQKHWCDGMR